ncbi:opsin-5 [Arapaima gigas]
MFWALLKGPRISCAPLPGQLTAGLLSPGNGALSAALGGSGCYAHVLGSSSASSTGQNGECCMDSGPFKKEVMDISDLRMALAGNGTGHKPQLHLGGDPFDSKLTKEADLVAALYICVIGM